VEALAGQPFWSGGFKPVSRFGLEALAGQPFWSGGFKPVSCFGVEALSRSAVLEWRL